MAQKNAPKSAPQPARAQKTQQPITLELVALLTPTPGQADKLSTAFGLEPVDVEGVCDATQEQFTQSAKTLEPNVHETTRRIPL